MSNAVNIVCEESVDISAVSAIREQLLSALQEGSEIILDASHVERIDACGLQLFAALFMDAQSKEINVSWHEPSAVVKSAAVLLGLDEVLKLV